MSATIQTLREKVKDASIVGIRTLAIGGLIAIMVEEALPEPVAKPIVIGTVLLNIGLNLWGFRKLRHWIHR